MVKKHKRDKATSRGERRSSRKVPLDEGFKVRMGRGMYASRVKKEAKSTSMSTD